MAKKKVKRCWLIADWRKAWKLLSVQIMAVIAAAQGLILFVPTVKDWIPDSWLHLIMGTLAILAIVGRVVNQGKP